LIEVQDEGSQLLAWLLAPRRGEMVADYCAGAGGKTLAMAMLMRGTGRIYALDVSAKRLAALALRAARASISNVHAIVLSGESDARAKRLAGKLDRVLVDAPCSGFGTLRRNPDLKWRHGPEAVAELARSSTASSAAAARLVKPGGRLVYATCSILPDENEAIADAFCCAHPEFTLLPCNELLARSESRWTPGSGCDLAARARHRRLSSPQPSSDADNAGSCYIRANARLGLHSDSLARARPSLADLPESALDVHGQATYIRQYKPPSLRHTAVP